MINAGDLQREPALQLRQRQHRASLGIVGAFLLRIGLRGAWKKVNRSHHGSNEPLDMAPEVRLFGRAVFQHHAVFLTATHQRLGMEFFPVIDVN